MRGRVQNDVDRPRTTWDDVLQEMKWLREDFKCDEERKKIFLHDVAKPCVQGARERLGRIFRRHEEEDSINMLRCESTIPNWAREEYLGGSFAARSCARSI